MSDIRVKCIFMDENGICHGRYMGFKCIEEKCENYGKAMTVKGICVYWVDGYCKKRKIFNCDGKDKSCPYYREYIDQEEYDELF